jgi:peptidoglycan/xylan/chitin deacetylase (PgdA/CDA1 family)
VLADLSRWRIRYSLTVVLAFCLILTATSGKAEAPQRNGAIILVYHRFGPTAASTTVSDAALDEQLAWLAGHANVTTLQSVVNGLNGNSPPDERPRVAITADDGHQSVYTDLYPRIRHYRLPVTLFIYPSAISNASYALTWAELTEMVASGLVDVQSHTYWHPNFHQEKARRTPADYRDFVDMQLSRSKQTLQAHIGQKVDMLAWPFAIYDAELREAAIRAGYVAGFLLGNQVAWPSTDRFALPRFWISDGDRAARLAAILDAAVSTEAKQR